MGITGESGGFSLRSVLRAPWPSVGRPSEDGDIMMIISVEPDEINIQDYIGNKINLRRSIEQMHYETK